MDDKKNPQTFIVYRRSGLLEQGVDRIVAQVVDPKVQHTFRPQVERVVRQFLSPGNHVEEEEFPHEFTQVVENQEAQQLSQGNRAHTVLKSMHLYHDMLFLYVCLSFMLGLFLSVAVLLVLAFFSSLTLSPYPDAYIFLSPLPQQCPQR